MLQTFGLRCQELQSASDTLQAWLTPLDGNRSERGRRVKVHKGFHASWRLNGMRDKVAEVIQAEICPNAAAAQRMRVLFTGKPVPRPAQQGSPGIAWQQGGLAGL